MPVVPELTMKMVPVSAFSGRPPSAGGLNRGSRQVPVQTRPRIDLGVGVRFLVGDQGPVAGCRGAMLFSQRVFQKTSLPLKNARCTPAARAASTCVALAPDQYSSWPTDRNTWCSRISAPRRSESTPREVADVVAVGLEPPHHRVLGVEDPILGRRPTRGERPVVADLVGAAGGVADVEAVAAVLVVGLPGRVGGLEEEIGLARHRHGR